MGLFFSRQEEKRKELSRQEKDSTIGKEYSCVVCPRRNLQINSPRMKPTGSSKPIIYILGESPGRDEDYEKRQFIGESGRVLRDAFNEVFDGDDWERFTRFNNVVRCFNNNETPKPFEIDCCIKSVLEDIEETKPYAVFGFGGTPLKAMVKGSHMFMWRGRQVPIRIGSLTTWYFPMLHPSFLLRNRTKGFKNEFDDVFVRDIKKAADYIFGDYVKPEIAIDDYESNIEIVYGLGKNDENKIISFLNYLDENKLDFAIDLETKGLKPYKQDAKILSVAIGTDEKVLAFPLDHKSAWNYGDRNGIIEKLELQLLSLLMNKSHKIVHNLKFELEWLFNKYKRQDFMRDKNWEDTMLQAYILDERTSKEEGMLNLDRLTQLLLGFNLKGLSNIDKNNPEKSLLKDLLIYNGMDTKYTYKLYKIQKQFLEKENLTECYSNLVNTTITLVITQNYGVNVDTQVINDFEEDYTRELSELETNIKSLDECKEYESQFGEFNPLSPDHLVIIFRDILKYPQLKSTKKGNKFSVDDDVLQKYKTDYKSKLAEYIPRYRSLNKRKSIYVDSIKEMMINDIIHTNFNLAVTSTGRLSSGSEW